MECPGCSTGSPQVGLRVSDGVALYLLARGADSFSDRGAEKRHTVHESEPISWSTISGLTDRERQLGTFMFGNVDLRGIALVGVTVNGEQLPDIVHGKVRRSERRAS